MTKSKSFFKNIFKPFIYNSDKENEVDLKKITEREHREFRFDTLVEATKNFHPTLKLGEGGFGPVYKGKLNDGREIAVKKLSQSSRQGKKEFQRELKLLTSVQHRNVVNLLGYCVHGSDQLLVYQYAINESLDKFLFKSDKREVLDWRRRYGVIKGIAKGLLYLHEEAHCRIIHRDIKASNILLDEKWVPKISDFGMARLYPEDETHVNTHVAGTNGYMAPEYLLHGHLSEKADVFSFGVMVLELISGQKNSKFKRRQDPDSPNLLEWAYKLYKKESILDIMDPTLATSADSNQVEMCAIIGLLCVQSDPKSRPSMGSVVVNLSKESSSLDEPTRPGYVGSSYRASRRPTASSSAIRAFSASSSQSYCSTTTETTSVTAITSSVRSPKLDSHGKRPITH